MIPLSTDQGKTLDDFLKPFKLTDQVEPIKRAILGEATPTEVLKLIEHIWRVGWLVGMSAVVDAHNQNVKEK